EVLREVLGDAAGEHEAGPERGVQPGEDLEGEVWALERLEPGGEQEGGADPALLGVVAGAEALDVHTGTDHAQPGPRDPVALADGAGLGLGDRDHQAGAGGGELLARDAAVRLGGFAGVERAGALRGGYGVEGLQVGDPELAGDGESGDPAEPVVGVYEVPVRAAPVRGVSVCAERFPQCGAEGRDR